MNEVKPGETESTKEADVEHHMSMVDEFIDLATTRYLQEPIKQEVYTEDEFAENFGADPEKIEIDYGDGSYWARIAYGMSLVIVEGGDYWHNVRKSFTFIRDVYNQVESYDGQPLASPVARMESAVDSLAANGDENNINSVLSGETISLGGNPDWADINDVSEFLEDWHGRAAESFKGIYLDRLGSILCGHTFVAQCLAQSLECMRCSYSGVRTESWKALAVARNVLEAYPQNAVTEEDKEAWADFFTVVSGLATVVGGVASIPTGGASIVAAAGFVAGTASIAAAAIDKLEVDEDSDKDMGIGGDTTIDIVDSLYSFVKSTINLSNEVEINLANAIETVTDYVTNQDIPECTVIMTIGDDIPLTRYESFFVPPEPKLKNVQPDMSHEELTSDEIMGTHEAENNGDFGVELSQLLDVGAIYLPEFASNFSSVAPKDLADGLESDFTHYNSNGIAELGPLCKPWVNLYEVFQTITSDTGERLSLAAKGLVLAAESFAAQDEEAAARLREVSTIFEG